MLRKNVADAVATPTSSGRASFWTARTSTCMTRPSPTPTTTMYAEATQGGRVHAEPREQEHADHEHRRPGDRERPGAADAADGAAGEDRRDQQAGHERNRAEARTLGAHAVDDLQEERDEDDRAEHRHPDREAHRVRDAEDARAEELERQDRLDCPALPPDEDREQGHSHDAEPDDLARSPRVLGAAPGREQDQRADAPAEQRGAEVVDAVPLVRRVHME